MNNDKELKVEAIKSIQIKQERKDTNMQKKKDESSKYFETMFQKELNKYKGE